jgi:hypothetical protein
MEQITIGSRQIATTAQHISELALDGASEAKAPTTASAV